MTWNYRIIKETINNTIHYSIHEVYYDENGAPSFFSENPITPYGEYLDDLKKDLQLMLKAFDKPVLDASIFKLKNGIQ